MAQFDSIRFQPSRPLLKELSADRLNSIMAEIRKNRPRGERGITVRQSGDGTYIGLASAPKGGQGVARPPKQPWQIYVVSTQENEENTTYHLKVYPGTISNVLPDNWNDQFTAQENQVYIAKARVSSDAQDITGVSIVIDQQEPNFVSPQVFSVPTTTDVVFGIFLNGVSYRTISDGSPVYRPTPWITVPKTEAGPGQLPYEIYYTLMP